MECLGKDCYWFGNNYLSSCPKLNSQRYTNYKEIDWSRWSNSYCKQEGYIRVNCNLPNIEPIYITTVIINKGEITCE